MDLSVIVYGRNDNYKSSGPTTFLSRLKTFCQSLKSSLQGISWELVMVDYNPLDNSLMSNAWEWTDINVNHVVVSSKQWSKLIENNRKLKARFTEYHVYPGHGMYAGFLHAKGDYVLYTSTDNIFPPGLNDIINNVKPGTLYRARRADLTEAVVLERSSEIISGSWVPDRYFGTIWRACGDFMLISRQDCSRMGGFLPMAHPKPYGLDSQFAFFSMCSGINIDMLHYTFVNTSIPDSGKRKGANKSAYFCSGYDHDDFVKRNKHFKKFKTWAYNAKWTYNSDAPAPPFSVSYDYQWIRDIFGRVIKGVH